jgi:hypothetical protein
MEVILKFLAHLIRGTSQAHQTALLLVHQRSITPVLAI